jgi:plastocyanin
MAYRTFTDWITLALLLTASLGGSSGCSHRTHEAANGAAPVPADTSRSRSSDSTSERAAADTSRVSADTSAPTRETSGPGGDTSATRAAAAPAPTSESADTQWVKYDAATHTATVRLVAGPFNFNGYTNGGATLTVPPHSDNVINFVQNDGTPHSAEIASGTGPIPNAGGNPAIPRAYTNKVVEGLPQGATDVMRFTAPDNGTYRIICGVPGHALSGMWIWYKVDPAAKTATFGATQK